VFVSDPTRLTLPEIRRLHDDKPVRGAHPAGTEDRHRTGGKGRHQDRGDVDSAPTTPVPTATPAYDDLNGLEVGECFDSIMDKDDGSVRAVAIRSCEVSHLSELFARPELRAAEDAPWPGDSALDREAEQLCVDAFREDVGIDRDLSTLDLTYLIPLEPDWAFGHRTAFCAVEAHPSQPFTDSVRGSKC
jgi:hypothetical protein